MKTIDWNNLVKQYIRNTESRIRDEKETLKTASQLLRTNPDDEIANWLKAEVRSLLSSDEKFLEFLRAERVRLKAYLGE